MKTIIGLLISITIEIGSIPTPTPDALEVTVRDTVGGTITHRQEYPAQPSTLNVPGDESDTVQVCQVFGASIAGCTAEIEAPTSSPLDSALRMRW